MCIWFRWKCWHLILIGLIFGWISSIYVLFVMLFYLLWSMNIEAIEELTKYPSWKSPILQLFPFLPCPLTKVQHLILNSSLIQKTYTMDGILFRPLINVVKGNICFIIIWRPSVSFCFFLNTHAVLWYYVSNLFCSRVNTVIILGNNIIFLVQPVHTYQGLHFAEATNEMYDMSSKCNIQGLQREKPSGRQAVIAFDFRLSWLEYRRMLA